MICARSLGGIAASSASPTPEACSGEAVPGGRKARMGASVSTWLTNSTAPPEGTPRFAVSPVSSMSRRSTGRARSTSPVRRRNTEPMRKAVGPTCQVWLASSASTTPCAAMVVRMR